MLNDEIEINCFFWIKKANLPLKLVTLFMNLKLTL